MITPEEMRSGQRGRRRYDRWWLLMPLAALFLSMVVAAGIVISAWYFVDKAKCDAYADLTGREVSYTFPLGCAVKHGGGWVPQSELRQIVGGGK